MFVLAPSRFTRGEITRILRGDPNAIIFESTSICADFSEVENSRHALHHQFNWRLVGERKSHLQ
jgi:hypothetical protein